MKSLTDIKGKATSLKKKLFGKAVIENFGDEEIREIEEYIGDIYSYPYPQRLEIVDVKNNFFDWCINYTGRRNK